MTTTTEPQDRKPAAPVVGKAKDGWVKVTYDGKTAQVREGVMGDFEFMANFGEFVANGTHTFGVMEGLFDDQYRAVMEQFRGEDGRIKTDDIVPWLVAVIEAISPN